MKKIVPILILSCLFVSLCASAAQLNPFAYGLRSELSADQSTLTVHYSLNSTATSVKVVVMNGNTVVAEKDCSSLGLTKGNYNTTISTAGFPTDTELTWKVEVKGTSVAAPTVVSTTYSLYHPSSIDIDNNPNSDRFGTIFCIEGLNNLHSSRNPDSKYSSYLSYGSGAGLYLFDASFTHQKTAGGANGYNGGVAFKDLEYSIGGHTAYAPRRVRLTNDGRIFISTQVLVGSNKTVLWEVTSFQEPWKHVMAGNVADCADNAFYAAPNVGFDVYGSGNNLKLAMLSGTTSAFSASAGHFRLSTYSYNGVDAPVLETVDHQDKISGTITVAYDATQVEYDNEGGFWLCQGRGAWEKEDSKKQPSLIHFNKNGNVDLVERRLDRRGGGIAYNRDYSQIIISGKYEGTVSGVANNYHTVDCTKGWATVYSVTSMDAPSLAFKYSIDMSNISKTSSSSSYCNINDFAWDYAGNVYAVSHIGEKIAAWAMPYSGSVSTPASSKYTIKITNTEPNYDNPANHLAPFAYNLYKTIEQDGRTKLHFMLNAHARRVIVWIKDKETDAIYTLRDYPTANSEYDFVPYNDDGYGTVITTEDVARLGLQYNKHYTWGVDVYGKDVTTPSCVQSYSFYHPSAVDIDNNPNNLTFGMILSNECMHEVEDISGYIGTGFGAGIYAFTADFKPIKNGTKPGFNGGITFTTHRAGYSGDKSAVKAYAPRRIRISEDGRIFATSLNTNGTYLWEIHPKKELDDWKLDDWTPMFEYKSTNDEDEILDANGEFIAGPNIGFDIKGTSDKLQLMMYSVTKNGIDKSYMSGYKCAEYDLGSASKWATIPSRMWVSGKYAINYLGTQVEYDNEGGFWIASHRSEATATNPGLVHINASGEEDFKKVWSNVQNAGIRYNKDFSKLIIAGISAGTANSKKATIYTVSKDANGKPVLTEELVVDMSHVGNNLNDFAWDYAGNLYACGNSNEKLAVYVMPRKATDVVSTPAREEAMIYFECQPNTTFDVTVATSNAAQGTVEGGGNALPSCEPTTVLAKSNDGYKFVCWKEGDNIVSRDNPYTFDVTHNTQLTAYFEEGAYSVSYWNLFRNGEDIAKESTKFPNTNERLWRLLQNDYYAYCVENDTHGENLASKLKDRGITSEVWATFGDEPTSLNTKTPTQLPYTHFVVASSLSNGSAHIDFIDYINNPDGYFYWMAQFIMSHDIPYKYHFNNVSEADLNSRNKAPWLYYPWLLINRTDSAYSITEQQDGSKAYSLALNMMNGEYVQYGQNDSWEKEHMYQNWTSFIQDSKPKGWRNWYTHIALGLDATLSYNTPLPVTWNRYACKTFTLKDENGSPLSSATYDDLDPSQWHKWTGEPWQYLIWRDGSMEGPVVEHVTRDNMKLYAEFGDIDIYEDRNNDRIISILERDKNHPTHPRATHSVRVHRPLQAGMYNTICLPFDLDLSNPNQPIKTALEFTGTTTAAGGEMVFNFRQVTELQAGMPYLVEPKSEVGYDNVVYGDVVCPQTFEAISHTPEGSAVTFHAVMNPTRLEDYENVWLLAPYNRLARSLAAGDMLGMRAYFTVNAPAEIPQKVSIAIEKNAPTADAAVQAAGEKSDARKVMYNERIYILRDGATYTIMGNRVK